MPTMPRAMLRLVPKMSRQLGRQPVALPPLAKSGLIAGDMGGATQMGGSYAPMADDLGSAVVGTGTDPTNNLDYILGGGGGSSTSGTDLNTSGAQNLDPTYTDNSGGGGSSDNGGGSTSGGGGGSSAINTTTAGGAPMDLTWLWWVGGGVVAAGIVYLIAKSPKRKSNPRRRGRRRRR